ncbi:AMP-binding enzyme [Malonomonas rubra DSM 5091]|uniref:ACP-SH:acetate ligase n=2 Tax=Malonomonas rubra TaxID=57040 RepID=MADH_MALRU|nr:AMP-binding protein [Malonomonas rubra]O06928.1 RecName: Full=ACP-SH:acetate ligase; AltName: Full=[Acyl-carrier protein]:acetate ligase [Malonomonas rubra]AAC45404.1 putative acyl carrier protein-SH: acetate [Malonomonas rubra]SHJ97861.1 AMP-binding enzyme [Malonomonas rubra DSM 5091]
MAEQLKELAEMVESFGTAPTMGEMPCRTLATKGINGPTAAHVIEEIHTPFNLAYVTFTTGSTAFQNVVGVTHSEIDGRVRASLAAFDMANVERHGKFLVTYAPLVNVFSAEALKIHGLDWFFLQRSSRDAFLLSLCQEKPNVLIGESTFIRSALEDASVLGLSHSIPQGVIAFTAGTPLDLDLLQVAEKHNWKIHDLYGCQEFGWLTLDGVPLRADITLIPSPKGSDFREFVVGGLPMADSFPYAESGHVCNPEGKIITYRRARTNPEYEVIVRETKLSSKETTERVARTILRIKGRVVKVDPALKVSSTKTVLDLVPSVSAEGKSTSESYRIEGDDKTFLFETLIEAQLALQQTAKTDQVWKKTR